MSFPGNPARALVFRWRGLVLLAGLFVMSIPASCGGDEGEKSGSGGTGASGVGGVGGASGGGGSGGAADTGAAGSGGSGASDASTDVSEEGENDGGGACNTLVNTGSAIELVAVAAPVPSQTGGTIAVGKYLLTELTLFTDADGSVGGTGSTTKETLNVTATSFDSVSADGSVDAGLGAEQRNTYAYTAAGTTLALATACGPSPGLALQYSASTSDAGVTTLAVVIPSGVRVTYTKQ